MLIHHENEEGQKAIISVFLLGVPKEEVLNSNILISKINSLMI
jgi:hypothetical protein